MTALAGARAAALHLLVCAAAATETHRLANEFFRLGVVVDDASLGGHTFVSELYLNQDHFERSIGFGWTANMLFNYSQHMQVTNRGRLSSTALVTVGADTGAAGVWHAPIGGVATLDMQAQVLVIRDIALGTAATETWTLSLAGSALRWDVERVVKNATNATCDRGPTLVINAEYTSTGHVLHTSAQIPSFLDSTLQWDPLSGVGFQCHITGIPANRTVAVDVAEAAPPPPPVPTENAPGFWTEALSNRTTQDILLSPSSVQLATSARITVEEGDRASSSTRADGASFPVMLALAYPTDPGTGGGDTTLSLGLTTIQPPSHAPATALPQAPATPVLCGTAPECGASCAPGDGYLTLGGCKAGSTIDNIEFASFGAEKRRFFLVFPMFVPSLSWQNDI